MMGIALAASMAAMPNLHEAMDNPLERRQVKKGTNPAGHDPERLNKAEKKRLKRQERNRRLQGVEDAAATE